MKTRFASKFIMFEETLEFNNAIIFCCGGQKSIVLQQKIPKVQVCFHKLNLTTITFVATINFVGSELELEENMFNVGF